MHKKILISFTVLAFIFTLFAGSANAAINTNNNANKIINQVNSKILADFAKDPSLNFTKDTEGYLWWISKDKWNIVVNKAPEIVVKIDPSKVSGNIADSSYINKLNIIAKDIFKKNNLFLNKLNSSTSTKDEKFVDYIVAYSNNNVYCTATTNPEITNDYYEWTLTCADKNVVVNEYNKQLPFLKGMAHGKDNVALIQKIDGQFALISVHGRRAGYMVIMKKSNNKWKEIFSGQDQPACTVVNKYKIPKSIIESCGE